LKEARQRHVFVESRQSWVRGGISVPLDLLSIENRCVMRAEPELYPGGGGREIRCRSRISYTSQPPTEGGVPDTCGVSEAVVEFGERRYTVSEERCKTANVIKTSKGKLGKSNTMISPAEED